MIGASGSVLIARMCFAALMPTTCWIAPLIPQAIYRLGAIRCPVWPIWSECGRQPALVTTREPPTAAPSSSASSSRSAKPSPLPTPRPPPTTTLASPNEIRPRLDGGRRAAVALPDGNSIRSDREQFRWGVQPAVLEQAAGPPLAGQAVAVLRRLDAQAVGGHRQAQPGRDPGEQLIPPLRARADDRRRSARLHDLGDRRGPAVGM